MRVLIADNQPKVRFALRVTLERQPGLKTIGEVVDAADLVSQVQVVCPDLAIIDWELPGMPIAELISALRQNCRTARVIVLSGHPETRERAIAAGANAFVCKCDAPDVLLSALDACLKAREDSVAPMSEDSPHKSSKERIMTHFDLQIKSFDFKNASDHEYAAMLALVNRLRAESLPDDPPIPLDEMVCYWRNLPAFETHYGWGVWRADDSQVVARGFTHWHDTAENRHLMEFQIQVLPEYRRQGLARQLLALIADATRRANRRLLVSDTNERVPAGAAFMERIGARQGLVGHTNQLKIAELNRALIRQWQARALERASDFELGFWNGPYPEQDIEAIVALIRVMNTAPRENLEIEDFRPTAEQIRQFEQSLFARGSSRWTAYVREKATGKFAGFTEVLWNPNRPAILQQMDTGVFPEYRNRGLGRWLKVAMLDKVLREHPEIQFVRTGNADSNAAMLKINSEMGFKPYRSEIVWQVDVEQVEKYLNRHS